MCLRSEINYTNRCVGRSSLLPVQQVHQNVNTIKKASKHKQTQTHTHTLRTPRLLEMLRLLAYALAIARVSVQATSNPEAEGVVNLGKISVVEDGVATSFYVVSAAWMQPFGRISDTAVTMSGGGRFYLAANPPTNATWEPGVCVVCVHVVDASKCTWQRLRVLHGVCVHACVCTRARQS